MQGGDSNIRKAPYEDGVYFVKEPGGKESTWVVGQRYHLVKILGHGSFSCVVLAVDRASGEQVALKRVGDVLNSPENAKRVLREVCIMRRLDHPCIIKLKDVYVKPSDTGKLFYRGGKFVPASLDLYMAMEYMNQGDLFHLRGQLSESEVRSMTWQILCALEYLHAINVWHRDIKSANIMVAVAEGRRIVKVGDFGSSRSAYDMHPKSMSYDKLSQSHTAQRPTADLQKVPEHLAGTCLPAPDLVKSQQQLPHVEVVVTAEATAASKAALLSVEIGGAAEVSAALGTADLLDREGNSGNGRENEAEAWFRSQGANFVPSSDMHDPQQQRNTAVPSVITGGSQMADDMEMDDQGKLLLESPASMMEGLKEEGSGRAYCISGAEGDSRSMMSPSSRGRRAASSKSDLLARPAEGPEGGFQMPLTRVVCTPCYRAPEVIMTRGIYSSAIDMWGVGAVFGELLQRITYIGKAPVPNLKVAPVFAITAMDMPPTPTTSQRYAEPGRPGSESTRQELDIIFDVIGTPPWASVEAVPQPAWRRYLRGIPARAPHLFRRFSPAGEVAVDLLSRLLTFDPVQRCSCKEAMSHEFFEEMEFEEPEWYHLNYNAVTASYQYSLQRQQYRQQVSCWPPPAPEPASSTHNATTTATAATAALGKRFYEIVDPAVALAALEEELATMSHGGGGGSTVADTTTGGSASIIDVTGGVTAEAACNKAATLAPPAGTLLAAACRPAEAGELRKQGRSLCEVLGEMLEQECAMHAAAAAAAESLQVHQNVMQNWTTGAADAQGVSLTSPSAGHHYTCCHNPCIPEDGPRFQSSSLHSLGRSQFSAYGRSIGLQPHYWAHLRPDTGIAQDPSVVAMERILPLQNVAMTEVPGSGDSFDQQVMIDTEAHLRPNRHGEWCGAHLNKEELLPHQTRGPSGMQWGVALTPPGMDEKVADPRLMASIRRQHGR